MIKYYKKSDNTEVKVGEVCMFTKENKTENTYSKQTLVLTVEKEDLPKLIAEGLVYAIEHDEPTSKKSEEKNIVYNEVKDSADKCCDPLNKELLDEFKKWYVKYMEKTFGSDFDYDCKFDKKSEKPKKPKYPTMSDIFRILEEKNPRLWYDTYSFLYNNYPMTLVNLLIWAFKQQEVSVAKDEYYLLAADKALTITAVPYETVANYNVPAFCDKQYAEHVSNEIRKEMGWCQNSK